MKTSLPLTIARRLGIGLAICVPALVVAQPMLPTFGRNQVLQAEQLTALVTAISALQANPVVTVSALYNPPVVQTLAAPGAIVVAQATCSDDSDVMVACGCRGLGVTGSNSTVFTLRQQRIDVPATGRASCVCQGANSGTSDSNLASAPTCIRVP